MPNSQDAEIIKDLGLALEARDSIQEDAININSINIRHNKEYFNTELIKIVNRIRKLEEKIQRLEGKGKEPVSFDPLFD